jgi:hypothetical protein
MPLFEHPFTTKLLTLTTFCFRNEQDIRAPLHNKNKKEAKPDITKQLPKTLKHLLSSYPPFFHLESYLISLLQKINNTNETAKLTHKT